MLVTDIKEVLNYSFVADDTVRLVGLPGIGKTEVVKEWAESNNVYLEVLYLSTQEPGDLIGIPNTVERDGETITTWAIPEWLQNLQKASAEGKETALFLDEIGRSNTEIRNSIMQLVLEREIHQHKLPVSSNGNRCMIIAADNPTDDYDVEELDGALVNRFLDLAVELDVEGWLKWARSAGIDETILSFISEYPSKLYNIDENDPVSATPRSWAKFSNYVSQFRNMPEHLKSIIAGGKIGKSIGLEFVIYYNSKSFITSKDVHTLVEKIKDKTDIEGLGRAVKELTEELEYIQLNELMASIKDKYLDEPYTVLGMLYSLPLELSAATLKTLSSEDNDAFRKMSKYDKEYNNFRLIEKIASYT